MHNAETRWKLEWNEYCSASRLVEEICILVQEVYINFLLYLQMEYFHKKLKNLRYLQKKRLVPSHK